MLVFCCVILISLCLLTMADNETFVAGFEPKQLSHIVYIDDDVQEFPRLEGLMEGYAVVRRNSSSDGAQDVATVRTNIRKRFFCWISTTTYVTNCCTTNLWSYIHLSRNRNTLGFVPFPQRPDALVLKEFFPARQDCLNFINNKLRMKLGDPNADIRNYQNQGKCYLWPKKKNRNNYVRLEAIHPITGQKRLFQLSHLIKYALSGETVADSSDFANNIDCSHRCHRKSCVVDEHLIFESQADNTCRNGCIGRPHCTCKHSATKPCFVGQDEEVIGKVDVPDQDIATTTVTVTKELDLVWHTITPVTRSKRKRETESDKVTENKKKPKKNVGQSQTVATNNNNNNNLPLISTAALIANRRDESAVNEEAVNETVYDAAESDGDDPYPSSQQHYMERVQAIAQARAGRQDPNHGMPQDSQYDLDLPYIEQEDTPDSPQNPSRYPDMHFY